MTKESDHQLVDELMDSVRVRRVVRAVPPRKDARPARSRGVLDIIFWSSLTNVTLLACFVAGWNFDVIKRYVMNDTDLYLSLSLYIYLQFQRSFEPLVKF